jgi:hypothetical protein
MSRRGHGETLKDNVGFDLLSGGEKMKFAEKIKEAGATGYILLWLLGVPIPILFIFFLLRGCT